LNRTCPDKEETIVLDFANEAEEIQKAFQAYYEKTILSEATDPNLLYDLERSLKGANVFGDADLQAFSRIYFAPDSGQDRIYSVLAPCVERAEALPPEEKADFRGALTDYVRLYAFLSQLLTFTDRGLEELYAFARLLRRYLPIELDQLPVEIQQHIEIESYRLQQTRTGKIALERGERELNPRSEKTPVIVPVEDREPLSRIIRELNKRFGTDFTEQDHIFISMLEGKLVENEALAASVKANTPENARLTFDHVVTDQLQDMVDTNFKFYKRLTDDDEFAKFFLSWLFDRFNKSVK
jgi:type I restriction enzyme R subunit